MNLLFRFIRYLVSSIFHLLIAVVVALFHYLLTIVTAIFRSVLWPFLISVLRVLWSLLFLSFTATVTGPFQFTDRLASDWTRRLLDLGAPRDHIDRIFVFCQLAAGSLVALGWVVTVLFTVEVIRVIYGWIFI